ncbi:16996_t:CDS:2 [Entrophospora sp. SA101]|nr:4869_t:CDS:2 [Entrophospora sp. SA101]CAJ0749029.1 12530_t:CDS:2 [Entrophospora sp. SA101]CAJ0755648.1 10139_t:CDS:2 [Entrophospora sp. SA101]CAJ0768292.1 16996_t:CDS:2 [Entrophospora sp. SA101]CAJ0903287.1 8623_t:CDS:2 [Entrophospora sp. SA101]
MNLEELNEDEKKTIQVVKEFRDFLEYEYTLKDNIRFSADSTLNMWNNCPDSYIAAIKEEINGETDDFNYIKRLEELSNKIFNKFSALDEQEEINPEENSQQNKENKELKQTIEIGKEIVEQEISDYQKKNQSLQKEIVDHKNKIINLKKEFENLKENNYVQQEIIEELQFIIKEQKNKLEKLIQELAKQKKPK